MTRVKFTTTLDENTLHDMKILAAINNKNVSQIADELFREYINNHKEMLPKSMQEKENNTK